MQAGRASKTAEYNALFRALETQRRDESLFEDPLAEAFLSRSLSAIAKLGHFRAAHRLITRVIDERWPGVRSSVVARTRLIDDWIAEIAPEAGQVVVLGAGFDTRASRMACLASARVFEVDHPDTQCKKRARLRRHGHSEHVRFVATDFHLDDLGASLVNAGYVPSRSTVFLWEGVTNYLDQETVDATLSWCAEAAIGSTVIFTYIDREVLVDAERFHGAARALSSSRRAGENVTFGMDPERLGGHLRDLGLALEDDIGAAEYRAHYYGSAARQMRGHEFYRVARARRAPDR